ncbi:MAG TPA: hypothetical protein VL916_06845, partial [Ilumatobacteraceae bacterium]|nr:hypothetical protein [Ilumatobacteraceae bacterium]
TATGTPGEFRIPVIVTSVGTGDLTAALTASTLGYRGAVTAGAQPGQTLTVTPTAYVDVDFAATVNGRSLDVASVLDLAAEFGLYGEGLGTIVLDGTRAPVQIAGAPSGSLRFRYWLTGEYDAGLAVTLTRLAGTWSYLSTVTPTAPSVAPPSPGTALVWTAEITVTLPGAATAGLPAGYVVDPASVIPQLGALQFAATAAGWTVVRDTARAIRQGATEFEFIVPIVVEREDQVASTSAVTVSAVGVGYASTAAPSADPVFTAPVRDFIDVPFAVPTGLLINTSTLTDGGAEFTLVVLRNGSPITITVGVATLLAVEDGVVWVRYQLSAPLEPGDVVSVTFSAGGWSYTLLDGTTAYTGAQPVAGTQAGTPAPVTLTAADREMTYLDVTFIPPVTIDNVVYGIVPGSVNGNEFSLVGPGAGGVQVVGVVWLSGSTWRYLLRGAFAPGRVDIVFDLTAFDVSPARAPPAGTTLTQSFHVVGATGDVVQTVPDNPSTTDKDETATNPLAGATLGRDLLNALKYLEIRFRGSSGFGVDHSTIDGDEIEFRDAAGNLIALAAPVRVGTSDIYRYAFTATLAAGVYTITILAGRFADLGGRTNSAETESFTVSSPTAALIDPTPGSVLDVTELASRGWVDITFAQLAGSAINPTSITDADA